MTTRIRFLIPVVTVLAAVAGSPGGGSVPTPATAATATTRYAQEVDGKKLFEKECASCHGKQGRGNGRAGRDFDPRPTDISAVEYLSENDDAHITSIVKEGKGDMDPIDPDITEAQIQAIVAYVRVLGEKRK